MCRYLPSTGQQEPIADPSLADGSILKTKRTPMLATSGPREVLRQGAEPTSDHDSRGQETPDRPTAETTNQRLLADGGSLDWPPGFERTPTSERSKNRSYGVTLSKAIEDLDTELQRLDVDDWRLSTTMGHQSRNPNYPYANQPEPDDPGVVCRWSMEGEQYAVACDAHTRVRDNLRTVGVYIREKRKMEQRPVTTGEAEFANARLPSGEEAVVASVPPHEVLGVSPDAPPAVVKVSDRELSPAEAAERFIARREKRNTDNTVRSYRARLEQFVAWANEEGIESMHELDGWLLDEYERYLEQTGVAPATVRGKLSSLDQLLQYCASIEVVDDDLPDKLEVPTLSKSEQTSDKKLDAGDARPLLESFRESMRHKGTAQHVVLELMWHVGGRISCFRALDLRDWDPDRRVLRFRNRPPTRLKDEEDHERNVIVSEEVADALELWIGRERPEKRDEQGRKPLLSTNHGRASDTD